MRHKRELFKRSCMLSIVNYNVFPPCAHIPFFFFLCSSKLQSDKLRQNSQRQASAFVKHSPDILSEAFASTGRITSSKEKKKPRLSRLSDFCTRRLFVCILLQCLFVCYWLASFEILLWNCPLPGLPSAVKRGWQLPGALSPGAPHRQLIALVHGSDVQAHLNKK